MPLTRFKLSSIADGGISTAKLADDSIRTSKIGFVNDTDSLQIPLGTTAQRPSSPNEGFLRFNTTLDQLEQYTNESGWQGISAPPVITGIDVDNIDESDDPQTIVISGAAFDSQATAVLLDSSGTQISPTTSTRNSGTQITIVFSGGDVITTDNGPYDVKVLNGSGLTTTLEDAVALDEQPAWTTASGSLGNVVEDVAISTITVVATDPETTPTYSVTSGALPTGLSLSSSGDITGTPNVSDSYNASGVTHNFTITADDGTGNTTPRAFSILRKWYDGSTSALAAESGSYLHDTLGITTDGTYWLKPPSGTGSAVQAYVLNSIHGGGWVKFWQQNQGVTMGTGAYNGGGSWTSGFGGLNAGKLSNTDIHALQSNGTNTAFLFSTDRRTNGEFRYWRYVEGSTTNGHHPRVSRIILRQPDGTESNMKVYTSDNCVDSGDYIIGTTTTYDAGSAIRAQAVGVYTTTTAVRAANFTLEGSNDGSNWTNVMSGNMSATGTCGVIWGVSMDTGGGESIDYDPFLNFSRGIGMFKLVSGSGSTALVNYGTDRDPDTETYDLYHDFTRDGTWNTQVRYTPHTITRCNHFGTDVSSWYSDHNTNAGNSVISGSVSSQAGLPICWTLSNDNGFATNLHWMGADPTYNPARSDSGSSLQWGYTSASSAALWIK